jgi:FixJ family two-component response regulator
VIVIDDASVRRALKTLPEIFLESLGLNVVVFRSAESPFASEIPARNACRLSDIYVPGMNRVNSAGIWPQQDRICRRFG